MEAHLSNSELTAEHRRALGFHHKEHYAVALAAKKKAEADFKNICKRALADGISTDDIKLLIKLDSPEGEAELRAELNRQIEVARWAGSEVGTQFSFLDEPDRTPIEERAYEEGKVAGYKAAAAQPPYEGAAEQEWLRGYHDGQQTLMSALDLTKAGMEEIQAEEQAAAQEQTHEGDGGGAKKKRGRPRKAAKNGAAHEDGDPNADPHAEQKQEDAAAFDNGGDPFPAAA